MIFLLLILFILILLLLVFFLLVFFVFLLLLLFGQHVFEQFEGFLLFWQGLVGFVFFQEQGGLVGQFFHLGGRFDAQLQRLFQIATLLLGL